ncbi:MAG TPA: hypothetical protein VIX18_09725 [Nitrospirota bacterium]
MSLLYSHDRKKELVNILLDSVYYLDLDLIERCQLLRFLLGSFFESPGDGKQKRT